MHAESTAVNPISLRSFATLFVFVSIVTFQVFTKFFPKKPICKQLVSHQIRNCTSPYFSHERAASSFDGPFNFTVGGLFWQEEVKQTGDSRTIAPLLPRWGFSEAIYYGESRANFG